VSNQIGFFGRGKQAAVDRDKGITVAPAERKHAAALFICHIRMVKNPRTQFCFLQLERLNRRSSMIKTLVRFSSVRSFRSLVTISAARGDVKRSQLVFCGIKETAESVLGKALPE
jgi:hypothetical protein